ncbi:MAG: oligosaccharide flippase family protein [Bacteroidales bacterium]|nr:oligosaccharide flippase family protein [Bacteroidales bacterium]
MSYQKSSYKQIVKTTSIFGGVQVFNIVIAIIRSKFVAIILGPTGMGITGLLNSTTTLISTITNLGLNTSAIKNVASENASGNIQRISSIIIILRRWIWITGTIGVLITFILAPWLSRITFGNDQYTLAFYWISITLLFNQLSNGQLAVLQGMQKVRYLAKANLTGSLIGLIVTVPLYYWLKFDGIVPSIIISSLILLIRSWYFSSKVKIEHVQVSAAKTIIEGKNMLAMGFMLSISSLISLGASYLIRIYISNNGGIAQIGLYSAGFAIINTYVGLIFTAMGTDYFPKLSAVSIDNRASNLLINQQAEVALLLLAPIIAIFITFIDIVIIAFFSHDFVLVKNMIIWAALGMFFKAISWAIGYIFLAKGNSRLFFWSELLANLYILGGNVLGYKLMGLTGLGISFTICYILLLLQVFIIAKVKYNFEFSQDLIKIFYIQFFIALICFIGAQYLQTLYRNIIGSILIIFSCYYSYIELDKRIDIKSIILKYLKSDKK